jgi:hypothetical protein
LGLSGAEIKMKFGQLTTKALNKCVYILATHNTNDSSVTADSTKHKEIKKIQQFINPGVGVTVQ